MTPTRRILLTTAVATLAGSAASAEAPRIVVGGKGFTEQLLMAEITRQLLAAKGFDVDKRTGMGSTVVREAQVNGQVDVYWEYTGTSLVTFNKIPDRLDAAATLARVRELDSKVGLVWLAPTRVNSTYALAVPAAASKTQAIKTLSDLAAAYQAGKDLVMGVNAEFPAREDGLIGMQRLYGFTVSREAQRRMETGLIPNAIRDGQVDVGVMIGTDGRVAAFKLRTLDDDRGFFPSYIMVAVVRQATLDRAPQLRSPLEAVAARLDDTVMRGLNAAVDVERKPVEDVAHTFLSSQNLI